MGEKVFSESCRAIMIRLLDMKIVHQKNQAILENSLFSNIACGNGVVYMCYALLATFQNGWWPQ